MYPTRLYLFWNTIPSWKIPSNVGCNIAEYNSYNCTRQNRPNADLTFKDLQNDQNAQNTFSTFCWCLYLWALMERHEGSWSSIDGSTHNFEIQEKINNHGWMLYTVYAVVGEFNTWCQLMIMTWRDSEGSLNFVFCDDCRVVDEKERDWRWRWEQWEG